MLSETPCVAGAPGLVSCSGGLDSEEKTDPSTPAPTSESPRQDKPAAAAAAAAGDHGATKGLFKCLSQDESFTSRHEPLTPDSSARNTSPSESPTHGQPIKRQWSSSNGSGGSGHVKAELLLAHHILESSSASDFQQPCSIFPAGGSQFDSSGTSVGDED